MRVIAFHQRALAQYSEWAARDKKTFERLTRLISETARTPFEGIGKPEPLKRELKVTGPGGLPTNIGWFIGLPTTKSSSLRVSIITNDGLSLRPLDVSLYIILTNRP